MGTIDVQEVHADTFPDVTTGLDVAGPYLEEPHEDEADSPRPATPGWENSTSLQADASDTWGGSFCTAHRIGFFCDGTTRVRCCRKVWGFVKCGTTVRSSACGWHGGGFPGGWHGGGFPGGGGGFWHIISIRDGIRARSALRTAPAGSAPGTRRCAAAA